MLNQVRVVGLRRGGPQWAVAWSVPPKWREQEPARPDDTGNRRERRAAKRQRKGREGGQQQATP